MPDFVTIPINFQLPGAYAEFDSSRAQRGLAGVPHKILLIGQKTSAGTAMAGEPILLAEGNLDGFLGKKSILALMAREAINANPYQEIYAMPLNDGADDVAAAFKLNFTGTVLKSAGTLYLYFAGKRIPITLSGGTIDTTIDEIKTILDAQSILPIATITAIKTADEKSIIITIANKGIIGNQFKPFINALEGEALPAGLQLVISQEITGVGAPDATTITAGFGDVWWTEIVNPYRTDSGILTAIDAVLKKRNGGTIQKPGIQFTAMVDSYSNVVNFVSAKDSEFITTLTMAQDATPECIIATIYAAIVAQSAVNDPARPLQNIALPALLGASLANRFTDSERNILIGKGASTVKVKARDEILLERAITTYKTNAAGTQSTAYKDLETINTLTTLRYQLNNLLLTRYPQAKLGNDSDNLRKGVVRPRDAKAEIVALAQRWVNQGLINDLDSFQNGLAVARDANNSGRLTVQLQPELIGQLRQVFSSVQFSK